MATGQLTCSNCRFWYTSPRGLRRDGDCTNPRFNELVQCISLAHTDEPDKYPAVDFITGASFGCLLFERKR